MPLPKGIENNMNDQELISLAKKQLNKSSSESKVIVAKAYALESIAASLIVIAKNSLPTVTGSEEKPLTSDDVELIIRRLNDDNKPKKSTKS
jgi:hypothetical protein